MQQHYLDFARYNSWANDKLISDLSQYDDQIFYVECGGSFPTIRDTLFHIWMTEEAWLSRLAGTDWDVQAFTSFSDSNAELCRQWQVTSEKFKNFVAEADSEKEIHFEHKGMLFHIPSREIVQTVCNHGTYHRGQVVTMMRQMGVTVISQTDYIEWVREIARGNIRY